MPSRRHSPAVLGPLASVLLVACADVWGFRDLTGADGGLGVEGGSGSGSEGGGADAAVDSSVRDTGGADIDGSSSSSGADSSADGIAPLDAGPPVLTTLASAQSGPINIALDATSVYWANANGGTVDEMRQGWLRR